MVDADPALEREALERANKLFGEIFEREVAAGHSEQAARAYAHSYAAAFFDGFLESVAEGRRRERERLRALHDYYAVHGGNAVRWRLALEFDVRPDQVTAAAIAAMFDEDHTS